jgi:hypothetical protein
MASQSLTDLVRISVPSLEAHEHILMGMKGTSGGNSSIIWTATLHDITTSKLGVEG